MTTSTPLIRYMVYMVLLTYALSYIYFLMRSLMGVLIKHFFSFFVERQAFSFCNKIICVHPKHLQPLNLHYSVTALMGEGVRELNLGFSPPPPFLAYVPTPSKYISGFLKDCQRGLICLHVQHSHRGLDSFLHGESFFSAPPPCSGII